MTTPNTQGDSWKPEFETWYENNYKNFYELTNYIERLLSKERAEGERRLDTYFQFIKQTGKMHEFVKWEEARTLPADSTEGKCCDLCSTVRNGKLVERAENHTCTCHSTTPDSTEI